MDTDKKVSTLSNCNIDLCVVVCVKRVASIQGFILFTLFEKNALEEIWIAFDTKKQYVASKFMILLNIYHRLEMVGSDISDFMLAGNEFFLTIHNP